MGGHNGAHGVTRPTCFGSPRPPSLRSCAKNETTRRNRYKRDWESTTCESESRKFLIFSQLLTHYGERIGLEMTNLADKLTLSKWKLGQNTLLGTHEVQALKTIPRYG